MKIVNKILFLIFTISMVLFLGCQQQHDIEKLKSQVAEMNEIITKSILENDPESSLKILAKDAISLPSYEPMIRGFDAIKEHSKNQPQMNMKSFVLNTTDVWVSGNFVVEIGTYDLVIDMGADTGGEIPDKGKYLTLFEIQKDGSLLIKADTWNTDYNPWERMMEEHGGEDKDTK